MMKKVWIVIVVLMTFSAVTTLAAPAEVCVEEEFMMAEEDLHVSQQGNLLVIDQATSGTVLIYTALGRCVYQSSSTHIQVQLQPGIYVIRTATKTVKFVMK